jgi:hypothetical protein
MISVFSISWFESDPTDTSADASMSAAVDVLRYSHSSYHRSLVILISFPAAILLPGAVMMVVLRFQ